MPETGSPPEHEEARARSVSPQSFFLASRCSTPGCSLFDGSPRYLFALPPPPPRPRSASPLGMAIKSVHNANRGHQERRTQVNPNLILATESQEAAEEPSEAPSCRGIPIQGRIQEPVPSLLDLTELLRLERDQARKCSQVQRQLYQVQTAATRTSRLVHTARSVQRTLAECIKSEDKNSFVNLFNAFHDALDCSAATESCDQTQSAGNAVGVDYPNSFLDVLSNESRTVILDFLQKVRHDDNFVADRLAALTQNELVSLLPEKGQPRTAESIFGSSPRTSSRTSRHLGFVADGQTELLASLEYATPLETLILSTRGVADPSLANDPVATDVWSTVCARLISEQKPGSDRFVPAVINIWALTSPWPGRKRLSVWISQVLQNGLFLLEQPNKQTFRFRTQGSSDINTDEETRTRRYYDNSVNSLLSLLGDVDGASVIPEGARKLCHAICRKLHSVYSHQEAFPNFVLTRWLFPSYLPDAIALPEIHGLMTDHFFPENMRKQVLREIAGRTSKTVSDVVYSWRHGTVVPVELTRLVHTVASQFQLPVVPTDGQIANDISGHSWPVNAQSFVPVSLANINTVVSGLCPRRRLASISSEFDTSNGGLQSSASSISGLSLFQSPGAFESGYRAPNPRTQDLQQSVIVEDPISLPENGYSDERVDSVLQPDWDNDRLWEACAGMEDYVSDESTIEPGSWCVLVAQDGYNSFRTLKAALIDAASIESAGETCTEQSSDLVGRYKCQDAIEDLLLAGDATAPSHDSTQIQGSLHLDVLESALRTSFDKRVTDLEQSSDFVAAHSWFRRRRNFNALVAGEDGGEHLRSILADIKQRKQDSLSRSLRLMDFCDARINSLKPAFERLGNELLRCSETVGRLRDKMWYVAEVRTSAAYDEARLIASALKVMGKPKKPSRTRLAPPLRHWSGSKVTSTALHFKTEAQTLELLSALPDYGGPNKLSDDQCKTLSSWMEQYTVENLCVGEERIHKLCMELRRAVDQLLKAETSPLLSSTLFGRDRAKASPQSSSNSNSLWPLQAGAGRFELLRLQTNVPWSIDSISSTSSHPLSARSSHDYLDGRSPALTNRSSIPFWSPVVTEARSPSSATSVGSSQTHPATGHRRSQQHEIDQSTHQRLLEDLRQHTTSLLLSELANTVFGEGSETDLAFWTGLGGDLSEKHLSGLRQSFTVETDDARPDERFEFRQAFLTLARRFEATCNPFIKLSYLRDIDILIGHHMAQQDDVIPSRTESKLNTSALHKLKRQGSSQANMKVEGFRRLFCDPSIRPAAMFRDLQYIAALVPSETLESSSQGKAFWNAAVAISSLKQEVRRFMVETADGIISYQSNNRGHARTASIAQQQRDSATFSVPSRTPSAEDIKRYTMADAAYLLQITAKEGDAAAQRELATLYLTHPELMDHIIAPFSRPREVFKEELESKWRKNQDPNRCDPTTMCVAHHWMSMSSKGGDALAKEFLKQREEMERLG